MLPDYWLKIPEPTKIPSEPNCIIKEASAGVAIPPAAKLTTGNLPSCAVSLTRSIGASIFLAYFHNSSSSKP